MEDFYGELTERLSALSKRCQDCVVAGLEVHVAHLLATSEGLRVAHPQEWSELGHLVELPNPFQHLIKQAAA